MVALSYIRFRFVLIPAFHINFYKSGSVHVFAAMQVFLIKQILLSYTQQSLFLVLAGKLKTIDRDSCVTSHRNYQSI